MSAYDLLGYALVVLVFVLGFGTLVWALIRNQRDARLHGRSPFVNGRRMDHD